MKKQKERKLSGFEKAFTEFLALWFVGFVVLTAGVALAFGIFILVSVIQLAYEYAPILVIGLGIIIGVPLLAGFLFFAGLGSVLRP